MSDDAELLRRYAETGSEPAFTEFVVRHLGLVYGAARRRMGDDTRARDVAQLVFTDAARHAGSLARHASIAAWLYTATRNHAFNVLRSERRRQLREHLAHAMKDATESDEADWEQMRPIIDDAMDGLNRTDRDAVLQRFFENRSYTEIGEHLRISENAARMRVERALDRLRLALGRRGVTSTAGALTALLGEQAVAAPVGLAAGIAQSAVAAHSTGAAVAGGLTFFAMNKATTAIISVVALGVLVPTALELRAHQTLTAELGRLNAERAAVQADAIVIEAALGRAAPATDASRAELSALQKRMAVLKARPEGVVDSQLRLPQNAGIDTPEATFETINWAINMQDWETFSRLFILEGEAREKAEAFFAGVRPDVRERYRTAERLVAQAWISGTTPHGTAWADGMQVLESTLVDGGPATRRVKIWQRTGTGVELANIAEFQYRPSMGWVVSPGATEKALRFILPQLDPQTGEFVKKPTPSK